ncbi:MAG TPA: hypothetical protein PLL45_07140, partial [Thermoflexales bacterium]|nr:hypothetical protein [Thermoflexales bacterium]
MQRIKLHADAPLLARGLFLSTGLALAFALFLATPAPARAALPDPAANGDRPAAGGKCDWSGSTNAAWETVSNWGGACVGVLPGTLDDVRVPTGAARFPILTSAQTFRGLEIESGAVMTIGAAGFATLSGDALISGTIRSLPASRLKLAPGFDGSAARFTGAVLIEGKLDLSGLTAATPTLMLGNDAQLTIRPGGSLVANAAPLSGNPWVIKGQVDNQGLMHVLANLSIESPTGTHTSTGHIAVEGESSLIFKGNGSQQVVLSGTVALTRSSGLNPPPAFLMEGGKLVMQGGLLTGTGAMALRNGAELALASDDIFFGGDLQLDMVQVTGRALVNRNLLRLSNTSVADGVDNRGQTTLVLSNTIGGKLLTAAGSTLR